MNKDTRSYCNVKEALQAFIDRKPFHNYQFAVINGPEETAFIIKGQIVAVDAHANQIVRIFPNKDKLTLDTMSMISNYYHVEMEANVEGYDTTNRAVEANFNRSAGGN